MKPKTIAEMIKNGNGHLLFKMMIAKKLKVSEKFDWGPQGDEDGDISVEYLFEDDSLIAFRTTEQNVSVTTR